MTDKCFYVYVHRRATDGAIFYVGKGKGKRIISLYGRNKWWHRTAKKYGWTSEKVFVSLSEKCAFSIEKMLIFSLKQSLVNVTDGGEGVSGLVHSEKTRKKLSEKWAGRINDWNNKPVINSNGEIFLSVSKAARILNASQGNIASAASGKSPTAYGTSWSYDLTAVPVLKEWGKPNKPVRCLNNGMKFDSFKDAENWLRAMSVSAHSSQIGRAAKGLRKSAPRGYRWELIS